MYTVETKEQAWDYIIENEIASEETLNVVTSINGFSLETLEDVLYSTTGYRSFSQLDDVEDEEEDDDEDIQRP